MKNDLIWQIKYYLRTQLLFKVHNYLCGRLEFRGPHKQVQWAVFGPQASSLTPVLYTHKLK